MATQVKSAVKVADEVWIATALLHIEHPRREDFEIGEIVERARKEGLTKQLRPGVYVHALQHCVANRAPNPGRYRMLVETGPGRRRLFRQGDAFHPARDGGKTMPDKHDIPPEYERLLDWYRTKYSARGVENLEQDSILELRGIGKGLWADEDPDAYVRRLRGGWE